MNKEVVPGFGRKRPQINKPVSLLHLDKDNPRLPKEAQGKAESELLKVLYKEFNLDELAESMAQNGYFDEEPLVAIPSEIPEDYAEESEKLRTFANDDHTELTVVEGNRRLATAKLLLSKELREDLSIKSWPEITELVANDLKILPVIVYAKRAEIVPYLGVRHIVGIRKWDSYAKARYIANMIEGGLTPKEVEAQVGDQQSSVTKSYVCYKLLEQLEDEFETDTRNAKKDFSLLILAIGQGNIKRFLGLPKKLSQANLGSPVPEQNVGNLRDLVSWIFGDGEKKPVIEESRDITNLLSHVVVSSDAVRYLTLSRDLQGAYDRTDGEERMVVRYLSQANSKLEAALGVAHRHQTPEVVSEIEKCEQTVKQLVKAVKEKND